MPSRLMFAVAALLSACSLAKAPRPNAEQLDNRIRVRVVGRESESVLSADHFVFLTVCGPDGTRSGSRSQLLRVSHRRLRQDDGSGPQS